MAGKKQNTAGLRQLLANKRVPLLTLDPKWHELLPEYRKTPRIKTLEMKLNSLLKKQGRLVTDTKEMKKLKKKLLEGIISNMEDEEDGEAEKFRSKKQDASQRLIAEINDQLKENDNVLLDIPYEIRNANEELLLECVELFYEQIKNNSEDIRSIGIWILKVREELKEKILEKQDKEMVNEEMYSYMHHILGAQVIDIFDELNKKD